MRGTRNPEPTLDAAELELVRDALREKVEMVGLRATARELKMSPTGLRGFIDGTTPYIKTVRRARAWYAVSKLRQGETDQADEIAIGVLVSPISESRRDSAAAELREAVIRLRRGESVSNVLPP